MSCVVLPSGNFWWVLVKSKNWQWRTSDALSGTFPLPPTNWKQHFLWARTCTHLRPPQAAPSCRCWTAGGRCWGRAARPPCPPASVVDDKRERSYSASPHSGQTNWGGDDDDDDGLNFPSASAGFYLLSTIKAGLSHLANSNHFYCFTVLLNSTITAESCFYF